MLMAEVVPMKKITTIALLVCFYCPLPAEAWVWTDDAETYACSDSLHPTDADAPVYEWESISETGDRLPTAGVAQSVDIGFDFEFYGEFFSEVGVQHCTKVVFGTWTGTADGETVGIPSRTLPNGFAALLWLQQSAYSGLEVYVETQGDPGNRRFVVEWRNGWASGDGVPTINVQLVLFERTGAIRFNYLSGFSTTRVVTVGIENADGTDGVEVYHGPANEYFLDHQSVVCAPLTDRDGDLWTVYDGDCDDADPDVNPGAREICDGRDNDCDGAIDERFDRDGDGFASCGGDCDDRSADTYPGAPEICDGRDNDCDETSDGAAEEWLGEICDGDDDDLCEEGTLVCSGGEQVCEEDGAGWVEICNGEDDDCDGEVDEDDVCGSADGDADADEDDVVVLIAVNEVQWTGRREPAGDGSVDGDVEPDGGDAGGQDGGDFPIYVRRQAGCSAAGVVGVRSLASLIFF